MQPLRWSKSDLSVAASQLAFRHESQGSRVDAIPQARRLGTVGEDVAQVRIAGF